MDAQLETQRAKLMDMFPFWGWRVRPDDVRLEWHIEADLSLAVWCVWHRDDGGVLRRAWAITEASGLLPIDSLQGDGVPNAHSALRTFALRWQEASQKSFAERIGPERAAELQRTNPAVLHQAERMQEMIGVAAELLLDLSVEDEPPPLGEERPPA